MLKDRQELISTGNDVSGSLQIRKYGLKGRTGPGFVRMLVAATSRIWFGSGVQEQLQEQPSPQMSHLQND